MKEDWNYHRGEVYLANLDPYIGSEQGGTRPVLVLQNNAGNFFSPTLIIAPISSRRFKKPSQPTHCLLESVDFLKSDSIVLLEQIKTIDKKRVKKYLGRLNDEDMRAVDEAIGISLGLRIPETAEMP